MNEKKSSKRNLVVLVAAVVAVAVIAAMVALLLRAFDGPARDDQDQRKAEQATSQPATPAPSTPPFTAQNAELLESALNSSSKTEQAKALVPAMREGQWSSARVLPEKAVLTVERKTFAVAKDGQSATVEAVVTGSVEARFMLLLSPVDGQWLLYATQQTK